MGTILFFRLVLSFLFLNAIPLAGAQTVEVPVPDQKRLLSNVRQLTFAGRRAGEGYFSRDGSRLVFQSEREPGNPFFQIYVMDLDTGDTRRVSPGTGKTTCAWFHPFDERILFASTHQDPDAIAKQKAELRARSSGQKRRYSWDYDENYDLFTADLSGEDFENLTRVRGYDAEGSFSPDGALIAFASNRHAYGAPLSAEDAARFERDPSYLMDIYLMRADGTDVRRLTRAEGYDGGPFFSADGTKIVWRRFSPDGHSAEIFTMDLDGSDERQITRMGAMSWAPFFHPSGDYIIFASNRKGYRNIELYLVDARGRRDPVRVTFNDAFDGLPAFSPNGHRLTWTSNSSSDGTSQIFLADWDDAAARRLLALPVEEAQTSMPRPGEHASLERPGGGATRADSTSLTPADMRVHVRALTSAPMDGRLTGTVGERRATRYVASVFEDLGLEPAGKDGSYFQPFEFTAGVSLGENNRLRLHNTHTGAVTDYRIDEAWRPIGFSRTGDLEPAPIVFAGYGIVAPAAKDEPGYDSYEGLDIRDKWVLVLRDLPVDVTPEYRQHLSRYGILRHKVMVARDRGARGLIVVNGPRGGFEESLIPLRFDAAAVQFGVGALTVTQELARELLEPSGRTLVELEEALAEGDPVTGFEIPHQRLAAEVDIAHEKRSGRNVLAMLPKTRGQTGGERPMIVIGAHVDHLGDGRGSASLARAEERGEVHHGADDNASGVAALLEIAESLSSRKRRGDLALERDILFAAWSGEELGSLGSSHFVAALPDTGEEGAGDRPVAAYLNMDMIGRLEDSLALQGVGSSTDWARAIEWANAPVGLPITTQPDTYLPTDSTAFYLKRVPILNAFTGSHPQYHTPRDTAEKLNYHGIARIARVVERLAEWLGTAADLPAYVASRRPAAPRGRRNLRASLGTIPDYTHRTGMGVRLSGVSRGGPAARSGLRENDVIRALAGKRIDNLYDYTEAISGLKIGQPVPIMVTRGEAKMELTITPEARE